MEIDKVYDIKSESKKNAYDRYSFYFQSSKMYQYGIRFHSKTKSNNIYSKTCEIRKKDNHLSSKSNYIGRISYYSKIILGIRVFREYSDLFWRKIGG